jgi:hypothetical protein
MASHQQDKFELMQNISDKLTEKTAFDDYINAKSGEVDSSKVCHLLSVGIWGLVLAKAKATFSLSDILDPSKIEKKYNKMLFMFLMMLLAQLFKFSSENSLVESVVKTSESKFESQFFSPTSRGPMVQSAHLNLDQMTKTKYEEIQKQIKNGQVHDFNLHTQKQKIHQNPRKGRDFLNFLCLYLSLGFSLSTIFLSKSLHSEAKKLHKMNRIYHNKHARLANGKKKQKLMRYITFYKDPDAKESQDEENRRPKKVKLTSKRPEKKSEDKPVQEMSYVPPQIDFSEEAPNNSFHYSLYEQPSFTYDQQSLKQLPPLPEYKVDYQQNPLAYPQEYLVQMQPSMMSLPPTSQPLFYPMMTEMKPANVNVMDKRPDLK